LSSSPAHIEASEPKLRRAGATRVVNPQRIAAAALQPNVVEFLDVMVHDGSLEFRLEEVAPAPGWPGAPSGRRMRARRPARLCWGLRGRDGTFLANPPMQTPIDAGYVLIAIGTQQQLSALQHAANQVG
jgi:voltage-gated potassium channel